MFVVLVVCFIAVSQALHCRVDKPVEGDGKLLEYSIDQPVTNPSKESPNTQFFLFGELTGPEAEMEAGFYTDDGDLRFKIEVSCSSRTWRTFTKNESQSEPELRNEGELKEACKAGLFDFTYELQQAHRGKFLFNAQPMEGELEPKMWHRAGGIGRPLKVPEETGNYRIKEMNTDLLEGTVFKAAIEGDGVFTRYAYGKCIAFPTSLLSNCTDANLWLKKRSKLPNNGVELLYNNIGTGIYGIGEYGAWHMSYGVTCFHLAPQYFYWIQRVIHPDENSGERPYCCCMHMTTGKLGDDCETVAIGGECTRGCMEYIDWDVYKGILNGDM